MKTTRLDKHISDLLFEHDCVIIPGFGGLVANPVPAKMDRLQHRFRPPSKEIGFNRNLSNNDGLLANQLVSALGISYADANRQIETYVQFLHKTLKDSGAVQLENVGTLFFDRNQRYRFEPDSRVNFRLSSFGLGSLHSLPIEVDAPIQAIPTPVVPIAVTHQEAEATKTRRQEAFENKPSLPPATESRKKRKVLAYLPLTTLIVLLAAYLIWLPTRTEVFTGGNFNYSDLNPFSDKICAVYKAQQGAPIGSIEDENDELKIRLEANKQSHLLVNLFDTQDPYFDAAKDVWVEGFRTQIAKAVSTRVKTPKSARLARFKYHLIAGCFGERENADRLIESLQQQGYQAYLLDQNKGLLRVSLQSFATRKEALALLGRLRKEQRNHGTWLLIK